MSVCVCVGKVYQLINEGINKYKNKCNVILVLLGISHTCCEALN